MGKSIMKNKDSRKDAKWNRPFIIQRAKGRCEACGDWLAPLIEVHHIHQVAEGGNGDMSNLVGLCPNCHSIVGKFRSRMAEDSHFCDWIRDKYGDDVCEKLIFFAGYTFEE